MDTPQRSTSRLKRPLSALVGRRTKRPDTGGEPPLNIGPSASTASILQRTRAPRPSLHEYPIPPGSHIVSQERHAPRTRPTSYAGEGPGTPPLPGTLPPRIASQSPELSRRGRTPPRTASSSRQPSPRIPEHDDHDSDAFRAPGEFPTHANDHDITQAWLSTLSGYFQTVSSWDWDGHMHEREVAAARAPAAEGDVGFVESEVEVDSHDDHDSAPVEGDYFTQPDGRPRRKRHWHASTPVGHPFSRSRRNKHLQHGEGPESGSATSQDESWNLISATEAPLASAENGGPGYDPTDPRAGPLSKTLQELDEVEIKTFLQNFSRHTREVRLLGDKQHFSRMPQWGDFVYSSDEETEPSTPAEVEDAHKRSRLLMHIDRGLQQLHTDGMDTQAKSIHNVSRESGGSDLPAVDMGSLKRSNSTGELRGRMEDEPEPMRGPLQGLTDDLRSEPIITTTIYSNTDDMDAAESAHNSEIEAQTKGRTRFAHKRDLGYKDDHVDGVAFCIAYILAFVERYAPSDLDDAPITEYRESRARSHIERLYIIAPFWENLLNRLRVLYCWEDHKQSAAAAMIYFVLWYTDMIPTAFFLMLIYYALSFRYLPPDESYLHKRVQQRMERGRDANRLAERLKRSSRLDVLDIYKRWQETYGVSTQVFFADIADYHEKIKNILLWRNPEASRRSVILLSLSAGFVTFCSSHIIFKTILFGIGFNFFALMPLQTHYPRYRRPLNPLWWVVLGSPTDAQYAVQLLRERHIRYQSWLQYQGKAPTTEGREDDATNTSTREVRREGRKDGVAKSSSTALNSNKLGSFLCQHHGIPGHLCVTPTHIYFAPLHVVGPHTKHYVTPLDSMVGLRKTHSLRLWLWSSNGLDISRHHKRTLHLANMAHRDDAFNLLLTLGSEVWRKV